MHRFFSTDESYSAHRKQQAVRKINQRKTPLYPSEVKRLAKQKAEKEASRPKTYHPYNTRSYARSVRYSEFDETRSALEELLDNVIKIEGVALPESDATIHVPSSPLAASAWWQFMEQCDAFKNELGQKNSSLAQGRAVGKLVGRLLNQNFSFLHDDTELTARLVKTPMRSRACGYYFELRTQEVRYRVGSKK